MHIREKIQAFEDLTLIKEAAFSKNTKGRKVKEGEDCLRTSFMVDRDRILNSKSFRRLKHKTQVFIKTSGDHYRTRLTHTLEVSQIGRTIGKAIGLNEDLIEAIALGHDLGHVAFAHVGEEVLNDLLKDGFKHNIQSVRVVDKLENYGKGLNLTYEVKEGIIYHSGFSSDSKIAKTLEGQVVRFSDKIAYVNHDIDDSIRAGLLREEDIPKDIKYSLGDNHFMRVNTLMIDLIKKTNDNLNNKINKVELSEKINEDLCKLRNYMFENIYLGKSLREEREKAKFVIYNVFNYYIKNPEKMPEIFKEIAKKEGLERGVVDYISGMSDDYCINCFNKIYMPKFVIY